MRPLTGAVAQAKSASMAGRQPLASAWWLLAVLLTVYIFSYLDRTIVSLLVRPIRSELGISDVQMSFLLGGAFAIFYLVAALPLGALADVANRRLIIILSLTVWTVATASCGLAAGFKSFLALRALVGIGEAALSPCAFSMMADQFPRDRLARATSIFALGVPIGTGVALICGSAILGFASNQAAIGIPIAGGVAPWRLVMFAMLLPGALGVLLLSTVREPERKAMIGRPGSGGSYRELFTKILTQAKAWPIVIGLALMVTASQGALPWVPAFFDRTFGVPAHVAGAALGAIIAIAGSAGLLVGGWLADKMMHQRRAIHVRIAAICAFLTTPCIFLMTLAPGPRVAMVGLSLQMLFTFMPVGVGTASLQLITPPFLRGKISALHLLCSGLGALAIGPFLAAWFTQHVFGSDNQLRFGILLMGATISPLAGALLLFADRSFRNSVGAVAAAGQRPSIEILPT